MPVISIAFGPGRRVVIAAASLCVLGLFGWVLTPVPAAAWSNGVHYSLPYQFDHNTVTYFIADGASNGWDDDNINTAMSYWSSATDAHHNVTKLNYVAGGTSATTADVQVTACPTCGTTYAGLGGCDYYSNGVCPSRQGAGHVQLSFSGTGVGQQIPGAPTWDLNVIGQESGHAIGLDHSCVVPAIMDGPNSTYNCGSYQPCSNQQACSWYYPEDDDAQGVIFLYGGYYAPPPPPPPCSILPVNIGIAPTSTDTFAEYKLSYVQSVVASYPPSEIPLNITVPTAPDGAC